MALRFWGLRFPMDLLFMNKSVIQFKPSITKLEFDDDKKWDIVIQLDYDNIRGVTGTIGWHW